MTIEPDELLRLGAATLGESGGRPMAPRVRPVWVGAELAGPAFPVRCGRGDNLALHAGAAEAPEGSVLCVSVEGDPDRGYWGEVLTTGAQARGIAGLVIDAGVRDVAALERHRFPVFSAMVALRGASKTDPGAVGTTATVGDVEVAAGDWLVGDRDGVVVIPAAGLEAAAQAARARAEGEAELFTRLRGGATTVELLGLDTTGTERPPR